MITILFFGSSSDSVIVAKKLPGIIAVVTKPPLPAGRNLEPKKTTIEVWATSKNIPVHYFAPSLSVDLVVSASYGDKIPMETIRKARFGGLNVHPSLLPRWRGGDPVPWAILTGDKKTGVTVSTLSETFDAGDIIAQKSIPITENDTTQTLRPKLFTIGAELLTSVLTKLPVNGKKQHKGNEPYARRLKREDGFETWKHIVDHEESARINRKFRALHPWPGLWTTVNNKRVKILNFESEPTLVQLEGKKPVPFSQFKNAYIPS